MLFVNANAEEAIMMSVGIILFGRRLAFVGNLESSINLVR